MKKLLLTIIATSLLASSVEADAPVPSLQQTEGEFRGMAHNVRAGVSRKAVLERYNDFSCASENSGEWEGVPSPVTSLTCKVPGRNYIRVMFYFDRNDELFWTYVRFGSVYESFSRTCTAQRQNLGTLHGEKPYDDETRWDHPKMYYYFSYDGGSKKPADSCSWGVRRK